MSGHHCRNVITFDPDVVLYHAECADGFGAAWALWKRYPSAQYTAVKHGTPPPQGLAGRRVLIVDFSYPRPTLERLAASTKHLAVLDHHITAQQALAGFPNACFDQDRSGAVLAWDWAHDGPAPWLLRYIQDKDLWRWDLPLSREINAALASYPLDFKVWDGLTQEILETEGRAILRHEQELVGKIVAEAVLVSFHGETVPAVQSAVLTSQVGERLSAGHPFCLIWHDRDGRRYFSLRSREGCADVGAIAAAHGGGGHTHAAGFSVELGADTLSPLAPVAAQGKREKAKGKSSRPRKSK